MSTNENIEDAVYEEVNESQEKVNYEIEVELTDTFLEKNPTIKSIYDKGKISIGLLPNVDKEFVDKIVGLVPELKSNELVLFNPLIEAINTLASQDFISEESVPKRLENEDDKDFSKRKKTWLETEYRKITDINKSIGTFNTTLKESKKVIKGPLLERGRKIDALYNALIEFSEKRKEVAAGNFPKYLDAAEKIKQAKLAKANAAAAAETEALKNTNAEQTEKIEALSKKSSYADLTMEISNYFNSRQEEISKLNKAGLEVLLSEVNAKTFDMTGQGDLEVANLESSVRMFRTSVVTAIGKAFEEFSDNAPEQTESAPNPPTFNSEVTNDEERFANLLVRFNSIKGELDGMTKFTDPKLEKVNDKLFEQIDIMKKTNAACIKYVGTIQEKYNSRK